MICEKCKKEHNGSFATGRFCSRSCATSRIYSAEKRKEISQKVSASLKKNWSSLPQEIKEKRKSKLKHGPKKPCILDLPFDTLCIESKRFVLIAEQSGKCSVCGIDNWLENPISLELDHIDGNNKNNVRENLRILCPNCHSQTPTWRGYKNGFNHEYVKKIINLYKEKYARLAQ